MSPINSPENQIDWGPSPSPSRIPIDFSPPLIAMVVIIAAAFFIVTYFRLISRHLLPPILHLHHRWLQYRHRTLSTTSDIESLPFDSPSTSNTFHYFTSCNGLEEEIIKTIPLSIYTTKSKSSRECAVCLLEFEQDDYVRTLPVCSHPFHVDCIDIWLSSHANCPLCRAGIFRPESPFVPLMAARIRPSLDDILEIVINDTGVTESEITVLETERIEIEEGRDFLFKRSYSFGFERSLAADRIVLEAATATPWRYRRGNFWSKRPSPTPFNKPRGFSFRMNMKSPFFRRRSSISGGGGGGGSVNGLFPLSESNVRSSRRTKSMTSPMFMRSSGIGFPPFSSSRLRYGDLEALLSPERLNQHRR